MPFFFHRPHLQSVGRTEPVFELQDRDHSTKGQFIRLLEVPKSKATPLSTVAVCISLPKVYITALRCVARVPFHYHSHLLIPPFLLQVGGQALVPRWTPSLLPPAPGWGSDPGATLDPFLTPPAPGWGSDPGATLDPFLTPPCSRLGVRPWCHAGPHPQPQSLIGRRLPS